MNRYQFEDSISAYLDNELSLADRKVFEEYIELNTEAKTLVDEMRLTMESTKNFSNVKASKEFMPNLFRRIEFEKNRPSKKIIEKPSRTLFGFTPLYATLLSILVVSFISIGINLWPDSVLLNRSTPVLTGDINAPTLDLDDLNQNSQSKVFVSKEAKSDTSDTTIINKKTPSLNNKIQFVKDQK
ncbi:MAG: zf-HC2 domain-containing protein [Candidatus Marinimicrobia bacterium]|nr:zf-HC2 domain-containing protein [Candidatus Neomarinimicrobiota bacterium]